MPELRSDKQGSEQSSIGLMLKARREQLQWPLEDIAESLRLRLSTLEALESDAYDQLPGRTYALGFLKSYATYLGLDAEQLIAALDRQRLAQADRKESPSFALPQPRNEHGMSIGVLVSIGVVVVGVAYAGWYHFSNHVTLPHVTPPAVTSEENVSPSSSNMAKMGANPASQLPPVPSSGMEGEQHDTSTPSHETAGQQADLTPEPSPLGEKSKSDQEAGTKLTPPSGNNSSNLAQNAEGNNSPFVAKPAQDAPHVDSHRETAPSAGSSGAVSDDHTVTVVMTQDSWVQIKNAQGKVVQSRLMKKGETWQGHDEEGPYHLTAGNAGGVVVQAGSVTSAPLGREGTVRHNVTLAPQDIINGQYGHSENSPQIAH